MTNRTILQGLKKRLDQAKRTRADDIPGLLWSYQTTSKSPTRKTLVILAFGTKAMIPIEVRIPSPRTLAFDEDPNSQGLQINLNLIKEARTSAEMRSAIYKQKVARYFNKRVKGKLF